MRRFFALLRAWFGWRPGLRFRCRQCGGCCSWPGSVFFTADEVGRAAAACGLSPHGFIEQFSLRRLDADLYELHALRGCPLLGADKGCLIYASRPLQCASFPFWRSNVRDAASRRRLIGDCQGTHAGPWYDRREVERRIAADERNETF